MLMPKPAGVEWGFYFDPVHIISVNYPRGEARLFENGGSGEGKLLFKKDEPAAKVALNDPFQWMNLAIHFVVSYELIAQVVEEETLRFFEQVGIKDFLGRLAAATSDADRHHRFTGLGAKFTMFKDAKTAASSPPPAETKGEETPPPAPASAETQVVETAPPAQSAVPATPPPKQTTTTAKVGRTKS
jgi:hypothetical protein